MVIWYRNSFLASVVSIFGSVLAIGGLASFGDDAVFAVVMIAVGVGLVICGKLISNRKAFNKWWKQVEDANLLPQIAKDTRIAVQIYNKNPGKRTLEKIAPLNPAAAEYIRNNLATKK